MNYLVASMLTFVVPSFASAYQVPQKNFQVVEYMDTPVLGIPAGEKSTVFVSFKIKEGYHIQADQVNDENLIPASLTMESTDVLTFLEPEYPEHEDFKLRNTDEILWVFSNEFSIKIPVKVNKSVEPGIYSAEGALYYQACDDYRCLFPRNLKFKLKVRVK